MLQKAIPAFGARQKTIYFTVLMAIAIAAPYFGNQFVTGPVVNATLLIAVALLGTREALLIAIFPSIIALATGTLPLPLAPQIPFIIGGNALFIAVFSLFKTRNYWLGAVTGSLVKFGFLFGTSTIITSLILNQTLAAKVSYILGWPQLVTALAGSIIAYTFLRLVKAEN